MHINCKAVILVGTLLLMSGVPAASAQFEERIPIRSVDNRPRPPRNAPRAKRTTSVRKVVTQVRTKTVNVRSSSLAITTEKGAKVVLELLGPKPVKLPFKLADTEGNVVFEELKPGKYKASSTKDDFETAETDEPVTIAPKAAHVLDMDLTPVKYKLKIKTNVVDGDILFARADVISKDASTGAIASKRRGNYCVTEIKPSGEAEITELERGYYEIDIRPPLEFEQRLTGVTIPDDLDDNMTGEELNVFPIQLEPQLSTDTFSPTAWIPADWTLPSTWKLDKGMKVRNAEGIALPQNDRYRFYRYFQLVADVKVPDESSIGFVLRAKDERNFYVLQISGPRAPERNAATLYLVKDGVKTAIKTQTTDSFEKTIASDSGFRIYITSEKDEDFTVKIRDSETGMVYPLAGFSDPQPTFTKGAVGIWAPPRSSFDVSYFIVSCTLPCK